MVIAVALITIVGMTFRLLYTFQGAVYALIISRESPRATLRSAALIFGATVLCSAYLLVSASFFVNFPIVHLIWNLASFFLTFYVLSAATNYAVASIFAIVISVGVPLWDRHVGAEVNLEDTLRIMLSALIAVAVTGAVELAFARLKAGDEILQPIVERLDAVRSVLLCYAEGRPVDRAAEKTIARLGILGTSLLRRTLRRSDYPRHYRAAMGAVAAAVGRLVDVSAALTQLDFEPSSTERPPLRNVAEAVGRVRDDLWNRRIPAAVEFGVPEPSPAAPLLRQLEIALALIPQAFQDAPEQDCMPHPAEGARASFFAADARVNQAHLKFALRGCLAAGACYITYNAVDWPGISTSVTTCLLTALSTIGASRQKQVLRLAGFLVGGLVIGMGSQIFVLPHVDSITGFAILVMSVTAVSAWVMTSGPRLSYAGLQMAVAFYLIHLQEFAYQTSLYVARDRLVGILFGLFMMWLVFDRLWSAPAGVEMKSAFISVLRLQAQLAREAASTDIREVAARSDALRETISTHFDMVRALADGVLFEFGPSRTQDLALRDHIRQWQPRLRTVFLLRAATLKYCLASPGFSLPESVRLSQSAYDERSAAVLEDMADRLEGKSPPGSPIVRNSLAPVEQAGQAARGEPGEQSVPTFMTLLRGIDRLTASLAEEVAAYAATTGNARSRH
jgi:multidrug resistance protein MdtO